MEALGMSTFGKCKGGGRRSALRAPAPLMAFVTTLTATHSAVLIDVSSTGARLQGTDLPTTGDELFVNLEGIVAFGTVAWAKGAERGIAFDPPLSTMDEKSLRHRVATARGVRPEIKAALDDWSLGLAR